MSHQANLNTESLWKNLFRAASITALLIVLVGLVDTALSMVGGETRVNSAIDVTEWFTLFQTNPVTALSNLGLINIITLALGIPIYLALHHLHQRTNPAFAALAAVFFFIGVAVYFASNTIFSMLALSRQYTSAPEAQRAFLEATGRALLAQGADLTTGTFLGLFFAQLGGFSMAWVVLHGKLFGRWTGWLGLIGFGCMLVFFPIVAFTPEQFSVTMPISMLGGLALMAYHILIARKLFTLSKVDKHE